MATASRAGARGVGNYVLIFAPAVSIIAVPNISSSESNMHLPFHFFRLESDSSPRGREAVCLVRYRDLQWDRPVFRAPTLPTPQQLYNELPFSVNFRTRDCARR
jgi:hypothetical protein